MPGAAGPYQPNTDSNAHQPPTIPSPLMRPLRNPNICHSERSATATSVIPNAAQPQHLSFRTQRNRNICHSERSTTATSVIPNAAQRSEESKVHALQTAFGGLRASDDDGGTL